MAPAAPAPTPPKKPASRASKRLEAVRASSNPSGVRKIVTVFGTKEDMVLNGDDDLVVTARVTARIKAFMPAVALVPSAVVPMRTRGKQQRSLGFFDVGL